MANYALVIGINHYTREEDGGLRMLKGAIPDAVAFHEWVCSPSGGNTDSDNAFLVTSDPILQPEYDQIEDKLSEIITNLNEQQGDRFYFYFAGHGLSVEKQPDQVALCLCKWSEGRRNYALSFEEYKRLLVVCRYFKEAIFILDCCRTEMLHVNPLPPTLTMRDRSNWSESKPFVAYATQNKAESFEVSSSVETRGVFTEALLDGLRGAAVNGQGNVDTVSLNRYLKVIVPIKARAKGFSQVPQISGHIFSDNELVFTSIEIATAPIRCNISFMDYRTGIVDLYGENANLVRSFDLEISRDGVIDLIVGSYAFLERATGKTQLINIVNTNPIQHVTF